IYGVSRQAVAGAIKVGENTLVDYENKLSIVKRERAINENLTDALKSIENGDINSAKQKIADTLKLLEE
ncbi:MAG: DNA-binding protein, partial [Clostridia bacterium]|nr:DNA-binding protein [Clostridia bacterium]